MSSLLDAIREAVPDTTWSAAVRLVRQGAVRLDAQDDDEARLAVRIPGRPVPHEVFLWPAEGDWGCDCGSRADACVHVAAAAIAYKQRRSTPAEPKAKEPPGRPPPVAATTPAAPRVVHALRRAARSLDIDRRIEYPATGDMPPRREPVRGSLARSAAWCSSGDLEVEAALLTRVGSRIPAELWPRLMKGLAEASVVTLDGRPIRCSGEFRSGVVRVRDEGQGFHVQLVRDPRIDEVFEGGVVRCGDCLHPVPRKQLEDRERQVLFRGLHFGPHEVGRLVGEFLPRVEKRMPLDLRTSRLPSTTPDPPRLHLLLEPSDNDRLEVLPTIVYGDPPVARVDRDRLVLLGQQRVPIRSPEREDTLRRQCSRLLGTSPGRRTVLEAEQAIRFTSGALRRFQGQIEGKEHAARFHRVRRNLQPRCSIREAEDGYHVELDGDGAAPEAILSSWRRGSSLVPLLDGGFAPLPRAWLEQHGWTLAELMDAKEDDGTVPVHTAASLVSIAEPETLPPSLARLRQLAADFQGLPPTALPKGLQAQLRPYQQRGVDWLAFLREAELGGLLADDMGLGKTLQALVAIASVPGPSLVVAPTSVLRNWQAEAERFLPGLSVCVYHGPGRALDAGADLVITSYALLRRDLDVLAALPWRYAVLDEAQAIKNPDSQVSRAARQLQAHHRLALTGTPVENHLGELWSLFAFVLPGFLGRREAFAERVADALGGPDQHLALAWLRQRVRPFILRRLKSEVAPELPARTEMIIRCELSEDEHQLYEAVRLSALDEVRAAIGAKRSLGVLEALLRLRQAACHPGLLPGREETTSSKQDALIERLDSLASQGHRALVFSQWTSFLDLVEAALEDAGIPCCRLDGSTRDRHAVVERFQAPDGPPVFLLSLKAGGTGLNLTAADYVFHLDPWWNPAVEDQAVDRAHRIGQTRPVFSVRLVAAGTVEERIVALQGAKRELARAAIGDEGLLASKLSAQELMTLFD
jgi:superfamily II DNA or RNA helicase